MSQEILEYDSISGITHIRYSNGRENWFDVNNKLVRYRMSDGFERWLVDPQTTFSYPKLIKVIK